jgi:CMP-N-acetylneuraminic acid synthetase
MDFEIDKYYRRQDYPVFFELSHWACVINRSDIALINSQLISPTVSGYLIPESDYVLDVDNFVDLQRAEQVLKHSVTF